MTEALIWVYSQPDDTTNLSPLVAVVVCGRHVSTAGVGDPAKPWNTTVMTAIEDAHEPLARHAQRLEQHGYYLLVPPSAVDLTDLECEELDPKDQVKQSLTLRIKRMIAGAK